MILRENYSSQPRAGCSLIFWSCKTAGKSHPVFSVSVYSPPVSDDSPGFFCGGGARTAAGISEVEKGESRGTASQGICIAEGKQKSYFSWKSNILK